MQYISTCILFMCNVNEPINKQTETEAGTRRMSIVAAVVILSD